MCGTQVTVTIIMAPIPLLCDNSIALYFAQYGETTPIFAHPIKL